MNALSFLMYLFIGGGFLAIAVIPSVKIFKKAGVNSLLALAPGANAFLFVNRICVQPAGNASLLSFLAFPVCWFVYHLPFLPAGEAGIDSGALLAFMMSLVVVFLIVFPLMFVFPLLSTSLFLALLYLLATLPPQDGPSRILFLVMGGLACVQAVLDFFNWRSLLKKLKRPLWHIAFVFVPFLVLLAELAISLAAPPIELFVVLPVTFGALIAGFMYAYYLGYSAKVKYVKD